MSLQAPVVAGRLCPGPAARRKAPSEPVDAVLGVPGCRAPPPIGRPPERLRNVALMMQGSYSPTETGAASSSSASSSSPRLCGVRFGNVDVLYHHVRLDDSKLPSDGLAPIGLGDLQEREHLQLDRYEQLREEGEHRRRGVGIIPPDSRRASLLLQPRSDAIEALATIEASNATMRQERALSLREYIYQMAYEQVPPDEGSPARDGDPPRKRRKLDNLSLVRVLLRTGNEAGTVAS